MVKVGRCKLTGTVGPFIKSHIIPRALSDNALDKTARIQYGGGDTRPSLKYTSWYDQELVTDEGEQKLAKFDDDAIKEFRRLGLVWRFFPPKSESWERHQITGTDSEFITIRNTPSKEMRMFFLSLLWRAATSRREEFREIRLDVISREKLRKIVAGEVQPHDTDFPCVLVLMTTIGRSQVHSPLRSRLDIPEIFPGARNSEKIFRFFLDGLIVHIGRKSMDLGLSERWKYRNVGLSQDLTLIGRPYENSRQEKMIDSLEEELDQKWPEHAEKIYGVIQNHG